MGPEATPVCFIKQAMTCIQRAIVGLSLKNSPDGEMKLEESPLGDNEIIGKLAEITGTLERCMETQKTVHELMTAKMKCTTCGATSVGFDCHNGASSTPTQRSSEERRKVSEEEDDEVDEKCSSIGSQRIASVDTTSSVDAFEHPIRSVSSSISVPADEEETMMAVSTSDAGEDHDLVMKSILSAVNTEAKEEPVESNPEASMLDQFLQTSLLGLTPDVMKTETPSVEENEEDKEQNNALLSSFFQVLFQNQQANLLENVSTSSENGTDSSQHSPPDTALDTSLALIESLLAESAANADATTSAEAKAAARKRKSTPMKVPKTENGAGYVCPMEGCNKVFKEKGSVHRHFVTHIGMRFNCDKCKASYTQKHALMLHQKIHANPDAYQCRGCGTNYTTQNGLRLHRQRNPTCMEVANAMEFNTTKNSTPTKHMVSAP